MVNSEKKYIYIYYYIFGIIILITIYFFLFFKHNLQNIDLIFFSLSYPSDPAYLPLIFNLDHYLSSKQHHFPWILILPEYLISKYIGNEFIWLTILIYKIILLIVLLHFALKTFKLNFINSILVTFLISIIISSSFMMFEDRFLRPLLTNIFFCFVFIKLIEFHEAQIKNIKINFFLIGIFSSLLVTGSPWDFLFLLALFIKPLINYKKFIPYMILGFLPIILLNIISILRINYVDSFHLDYLGSKDIYDRFTFFKDYLFNVFSAKKNLILLMFVFTSSLYLRKYYLISSLICCILISIFPSLLSGKTLQSYHFIQSSFNVCLLFAYVSSIFLIKRYFNNKSTFLSFIKLISFFFVSIFIFSKFTLNNNYLERVNNNYNLYKEHIVGDINIDKKCEIISNDLFLRAYYIYKGYKVLPEDGFYQTRNIKSVINDQNIIIKQLKEKHDINLNSELNFLNSATHNYFSASRSTLPNQLKYILPKLKLDLKKIGSFDPWPQFTYLDYISNNYKYFPNIEKIKNNKIISENYYLILNIGTLRNPKISNKDLCKVF